LKVEVNKPGSRPAEEFRVRARNTGRRALVAPVALAAILAAGIARAESFRLVPSVEVAQTYSDNVALVPGELARSGWVTGISPGIRADLAGARVKGSLDYRLTESLYSADSRLNSTQNFLDSFAKVEAVDKLLFVEARANISQQNRSPFGAAATPDLSTPSANRVETSVYQVAPTLRGQLSDIASYQLRLSETNVHADDVSLPDTRTTEWAGKISNASPSAKLGWAVDASALRLRSEAAGTLEDSRIRGSLVYAFDPQFHVSGFAGHESTDFAGPPRRGTNTPGVGLEWSPSVRTQLAAVREKRFFGDGHNVIFSHRTPLTAWRLESTKDAAVLPAQLTASSSSSIQALMSDLLTSAIPDPEARAQAARRKLEETGISGISALNSNFASARPFILRNEVASFALLGAIHTITLSVIRREQRAFGVSPAGEGGSADDFRQKGFSANLARKLSPLTTLTLAATSLQTDDLTITTRQTRQHFYSASLATRLSPRTSAALGVRRVEFDSSIPIESYRENAIFASVSIRR
jgi:uncharacterized protein (PEP-CTERM system associated)